MGTFAILLAYLGVCGLPLPEVMYGGKPCTQRRGAALFAIFTVATAAGIAYVNR